MMTNRQVMIEVCSLKVESQKQFVYNNQIKYKKKTQIDLNYLNTINIMVHSSEINSLLIFLYKFMSDIPNR